MSDMTRRAPKDETEKVDLENPFEIAALVRRFYSRVSEDDLLGPIFNDVAEVDWSEHLPKLTAFWSGILLGIPGFRGAPMQAHFRIHSIRPLTPEHFQRWIDLFFETVDAGWSGRRADHAKDVATSVANAHGRRLAGSHSQTGGDVVSLLAPAHVGRD